LCYYFFFDLKTKSLLELLPNAVEIKIKTRFSLTCNDTSSEKSGLDLHSMNDFSHSNASSGSIQIDVLNANLYNLEASNTNYTNRVIEKWNKITTCIIDNRKVIVNRASWITKNGKPVRYCVDSIGYPL
jgi:hypothetical protein